MDKEKVEDCAKVYLAKMTKSQFISYSVFIGIVPHPWHFNSCALPFPDNADIKYNKSKDFFLGCWLFRPTYSRFSN